MTEPSRVSCGRNGGNCQCTSVEECFYERSSPENAGLYARYLEVLGHLQRAWGDDGGNAKINNHILLILEEAGGVIRAQCALTSPTLGSSIDLLIGLSFKRVETLNPDAKRRYYIECGCCGGTDENRDHYKTDIAKVVHKEDCPLARDLPILRSIGLASDAAFTSPERCEHKSVHDGPRVEARWGTVPTQVCDCGAWRTMHHTPGQWQNASVAQPQSAEAPGEDDLPTKWLVDRLRHLARELVADPKTPWIGERKPELHICWAAADRIAAFSRPECGSAK